MLNDGAGKTSYLYTNTCALFHPIREVLFRFISGLGYLLYVYHTSDNFNFEFVESCECQC